MIVITVEPTELEILDQAWEFLENQIKTFSKNSKKKKALQDAIVQRDRLEELRRVVTEEKYPLVGLWVRKADPTAAKVVGQITSVDKDNFWVKYWGSPTPYPESPGLLEWDEFAQGTTLKDGDSVRIKPGHNVYKPGEIFKVQDLQANGWVLTTDDNLIAPEYWEIANETPRSESSNSADAESLEPAEDDTATTAGDELPPQTTQVDIGMVEETEEDNLPLADRDVQEDGIEDKENATLLEHVVVEDFPQAFVKGQWYRILHIQGETLTIDDPYSDSVWSLDAVELNKEAIALLDDSQLTTILNTEGDLAFSAASEALSRARKAGVYLLEQKRRIKHGGWLPWLHENCPRISDRTAQVWMKIAKNWEEVRKNAATADIALDALSIDGAMKLLRAESRGQKVEGNEETSGNPPLDADADAETERDLMAFLDKSVSFSPNKLNWALINVATQTSKQLGSLEAPDLELLIEKCQPLVEAAKNELSQRQQIA